VEKSVYSLVLMDQVIKEIDRLAHANSTSRSNLINQILAEYVSFVTPEQRMKGIFEEMTRTFDRNSPLQLQEQPSDAMISFRSAISFKYNPTIRYSIELYRSHDSAIGELKVLTRTSSERLVALLEEFYRSMILLEKAYAKQYFPGKEIRFTVDGGRFYRSFSLPDTDHALSTQEIGKAIANYIKMFDKAMKLFFENCEELHSAVTQIEALYFHYLKNTPVIL